MRGTRRTVLLVGAGTLSAAGLWLGRGAMPPPAKDRSEPHNQPSPGRVLASVHATADPRAQASSPRAATTPRPSAPPTISPPSARPVAVRFLRAFAALLYGRGDPEALPGASPAVREQANSAPDLAAPGPPRPHRLRGPWPGTGGVPEPGDLRLHAEVADPTQVLEVDLELAPDRGAHDRWTVVGLGW